MILEMKKSDIFYLKYILLIQCFLIIECKHDKSAYGTEVNTKDSVINVRKLVNHKLTEEIEYYYPNKELKSKVGIKDGIKDGHYVEYYINGQIKISAFIKNRHWINKYEAFSNSGQLEKIHIIESDSFQGELIHYFPNQTLSMYCLSDFDGKLYHVTKWDTLGKKYYDEGVVFSPSIKCNSKLDSLPKDKLIEFYAAVSVFDKYKTIMKAGLNMNELTQLELDRHKATYRTSFKQSGKNQLTFLGVMYDSLGNVFKTDTTRLNINVIE